MLNQFNPLQGLKTDLIHHCKGYKIDLIRHCVVKVDVTPGWMPSPIPIIYQAWEPSHFAPPPPPPPPSLKVCLCVCVRGPQKQKPWNNLNLKLGRESRGTVRRF